MVELQNFLNTPRSCAWVVIEQYTSDVFVLHFMYSSSYCHIVLGVFFVDNNKRVHVHNFPRSDDRIYDLRLLPRSRDEEQDIRGDSVDVAAG